MSYDPTKNTQKATRPKHEKHLDVVPPIGAPLGYPPPSTDYPPQFRQRQFNFISFPLDNAGPAPGSNDGFGGFSIQGAAFMFWFSTNATDQLGVVFDGDSNTIPMPLLPGMGFIGRPFKKAVITVTNAVAGATATIMFCEAYPDEEAFKFQP